MTLRPMARCGAAYSSWIADDASYRAEHPRKQQHLTRTQFVGYSEFGASSLYRQVFESEQVQALNLQFTGLAQNLGRL